MIAIHRHRPQLLQNAGAGLEVLDGLKQWHHVNLLEPDFLEQHHRFQNVGNGTGHGNDAMRDRLRTQVAHSTGGRAENTELFSGVSTKFRIREEQRAIGLQLLDQQRNLLFLSQRAVLIDNPRFSENLREHVLKGLRVLAHVQRIQVEAERRYGGAQAREAVVGDDVIVELAQRTVNDVEVTLELLRGGIRACRRLPLHHLERLLHAVPDAVDGAAVRFVDAGLVVVICGVGKHAELFRARGIAIREGQLALQLPKLFLVVTQHGLRGLAGGVGEGVLGDIGVAVVVSTNPGTGAHDRGVRQLLAKGVAHSVADGAVKRRDLVQEGKLVVAQADVHLIFQGRARDTDERGLPQQRHAQVHLFFNRRHISAAVGFLQQVLDARLRVEDGAAAGFGGVCGEHGGDVGAADGGSGVGSSDAFGLELGKGFAQRDRRVDGLVIQVLRQVRNEREITKRAGHEVDLGDVEVSEDGDEVLGLGIAVSDVEGHAASRFDKIKDVLTLLLGDDPAEHPAEESDIFADDFWGGCAHGEPFWA